jgi:hypothetical protein
MSLQTGPKTRTKKRPKHRALLIFSGTIALISIGLLWLDSQAVSAWIRDGITSKIHERCPGCRLSIGELSFELRGPSVTARRLRFQAQGSTEVEAEIDEMRADLDLKKLFDRALAFKKIRLSAPEVRVTERERAKAPEEAPGLDATPPFPLGLPPFLIENLRVEGGVLTYVHEQPGKQGASAALHLRGVNGSIANFATRPQLSRGPTEMEAACMLERSGSGHIHADFDLLAKKNDDKIEIDLKELKLAEMDPYFSNEDGVLLDGVLHHAYAALEVREGVLSGSLIGNYEGLKIHYRSTADRSAIKAFFSSLIGSIRVPENRTNDPVKNPPELVHEIRNQAEGSIIKFLLGGLKPAAYKILTH